MSRNNVTKNVGLIKFFFYKTLNLSVDERQPEEERRIWTKYFTRISKPRNFYTDRAKDIQS